MEMIRQNGLSNKFASEGEEINIKLSHNSIDIDYVNNLKAQKPAFIAINFSNPWIISEIDNGNTNTILATFGTTPDALLDVITGKFNPTGKMPFSTPVSDEAVENQKEDVPGYMEEDGYALFNYDEGIGY